MTETIEITTEYITLGQLLKLGGVVGSGGEVKPFLAEYEVYLNGEPENRRGKKLYDGDIVDLPDIGKFKISR
ncbi:MAG TPA: S4 domain-containing protein YaaA [Bacillales bacterium]|nr:S4 domain-containing protein YaaA [Bacillales bacterium]